MFRAQEIAPELASSASSSFKAEELQVMAFTAKIHGFSMVFQWKLFTFMVDFHGFSISMLAYWRAMNVWMGRN